MEKIMTKLTYPGPTGATFSALAYKEITPAEILKTAMRLIRSARKTIRATMNAAEEIEHPLPREYFLLLPKKMAAGILVQRVGFGNKKDFSSIKDRIEINHPYYKFHRIGKRNYKRMLLIDNSKLLFAKKEKGHNRYFYTEDKKLVGYYKKYFQACWKKK
ncbi:MAG: hypothetical protein Q8Q17_01885 [bacterium]|nr:hypothetical protein [bacterium]